jgi:hypothetical protein
MTKAAFSFGRQFRLHFLLAAWRRKWFMLAVTNEPRRKAVIVGLAMEATLSL